MDSARMIAYVAPIEVRLKRALSEVESARYQRDTAISWRDAIEELKQAAEREVGRLWDALASERARVDMLYDLLTIEREQAGTLIAQLRETAKCLRELLDRNGVEWRHRVPGAAP
jgi:hypothetical protein